MLKIILLFVLLLGSLFSKDFTREYIYNIGDNDSKNSARAIALAEVKKILIEEIGVHIYSKIEINKININGKSKKESKKTLESITAGITKTQIIDEKYDGKTFIILAKISVDVDTFNAKLKQILAKKNIVKQLEKTLEEKNKIIYEKKELQISLKNEQEKIKLLKKQLNNIKNNKVLKLKKELELKESKIKLLNNNLAYKENSTKLQLNELVQKGNESYHNKEYNQALAYFITVKYLGYENSYLPYNLGNINYKLTKYLEAIKFYKEFIKEHNESIEAYNNIAVCYEKLNDFKNSVKYYNYVLKIDTENSNAYNNLGILYYNNNKNDKAIFYLERAAILGNKEAIENLKIIK